MKKFLAFLFSCCVTAFSLHAQLLYKCESPAGDTITWIMGTMHYTDRDGFREDPIFDSLIASSEVFFEEPLLNEHLTREQQARLSLAQRYEGGKTLRDFVSKKELKKLTAQLSSELRVAPSIIRNAFIYAPFFMLSKLPPKDSSRHLEIDDYLINKAKFYKRRIVPLDHPDSIYQTALILRQRHQPDWLMRVYATYFKSNALLEKAYRAQDTAKVIGFLGTSADTLLITRRNEQWVKIIERESGKKNFIEAGLAHVITPFDGLLDYFRRRNWKVTGVDVAMFTTGTN